MFEGEVADRAEAGTGAVLDGDVLLVVLERAVLDEHVVGGAEAEIAVGPAGQARVEGAVGGVPVLVLKADPHQIDIVDPAGDFLGCEDGGREAALDRAAEQQGARHGQVPGRRVAADEDGVLGGDAAQVPVFQVFLGRCRRAQEYSAPPRPGWRPSRWPAACGRRRGWRLAG